MESIPKILRYSLEREGKANKPLNATYKFNFNNTLKRINFAKLINKKNISESKNENHSEILPESIKTGYTMVKLCLNFILSSFWFIMRLHYIFSFKKKSLNIIKMLMM